MHSSRNLFQDRQLVIATKHRKEDVIASLMERELGMKCFVPADFDTDVLGTFTGEIEREGNPVKTLRLKCLMAMEKYNCDLGIASEGSFGPHPTIFFANADDELMILIDKKNNLEIIARELSTETNFNGSVISSEKQLSEFAFQACFPSHALILRNEKDSQKQIYKGITDRKTLWEAYHSLQQTFGSTYAETDMRANYNPTLMKVIEKATQKLVIKINSQCPSCQTPGFDVKKITSGLPCDYCGSPTPATLRYTYVCAKCSHAMEELYPHGKKTEDPMYCPICNP